MSTIDLNGLGQLHSPQPEPDRATLAAREHKAQLMSDRVLANCLSQQAIDAAKSSSDQPPSHESRLAVDPRFSEGPADISDVGTIATHRDMSMEFRAKVQQAGQGAFQAGTIWLPVPQTFVELDLPLEVRVLRFDAGDETSEARLVPIDVHVAEQYPHGNGAALLTLEPRYWDDPSLPPGYSSGKFEALASIGLVGTAKAPDIAIVVVACMATLKSPPSA